MGVQTPENKAKNFVRDFMRKEFPDIWYFSPPAGLYGRAGVPDHLYLYKGILIAIEVKAEQGRLQDSQKLQIAHLQRQNAIVAVVYGKDLNKMLMIKKAIIARLESQCR